MSKFFFVLCLQEEIKEESLGSGSTEKTKPITIKQEPIEEEGKQTLI